MQVNNQDKMTNKEKIIYHILLENPMLSQEEIAYKANMSRSSVSVHISNLMTKGVIIGRSYVVQSTGYIIVLGESIVEIHGNEKVNSLNQNNINLKVSGSGINITSKLQSLNIPSKIITTLPNNYFGTLVQSHCNSLGIDLKHSYYSREDVSNLCLMLSTHNERHRVYDNKAMDILPINHLLNHDRIIRDANIILIESSFNYKANKYIIERYPDKCIFLSLYNIGNIEDITLFMNSSTIIHCSKQTLEIIVTKNFNDEKKLIKEGKKLLSEKTEILYVTTNSMLVIISNSLSRVIRFENLVEEDKMLFNHFSASLASAILKKYDYEQSALFALEMCNVLVDEIDCL